MTTTTFDPSGLVKVDVDVQVGSAKTDKNTGADISNQALGLMFNKDDALATVNSAIAKNIFSMAPEDLLKLVGLGKMLQAAGGKLETPPAPQQAGSTAQLLLSVANTKLDTPERSAELFNKVASALGTVSTLTAPLEKSIKDAVKSLKDGHITDDQFNTILGMAITNAKAPQPQEPKDQIVSGLADLLKSPTSANVQKAVTTLSILLGVAPETPTMPGPVDPGKFDPVDTRPQVQSVDVGGLIGTTGADGSVAISYSRLPDNGQVGRPSPTYMTTVPPAAIAGTRTNSGTEMWTATRSADGVTSFKSNEGRSFSIDAKGVMSKGSIDSDPVKSDPATKGVTRLGDYLIIKPAYVTPYVLSGAQSERGNGNAIDYGRTAGGDLVVHFKPERAEAGIASFMGTFKQAMAYVKSDLEKSSALIALANKNLPDYEDLIGQQSNRQLG